MNAELSRWLNVLNPEQRQAVTAPNGALLIVAGAGSGKTRVLTSRIGHLISQGVPHFNILGVTFTNKAAEEMKYRVGQLVQSEVWVSTFHSTCLRILRLDGGAVGLRQNFTIYDEHDQLVLIKECLIELNKNDRQINPKGIREEIQRAKDYLLTPQAYAQRAGDPFESTAAEVYERYEAKMKALNGCDFGDLILKTVFLFQGHPDILASWQERFQHVLIDEYQDTNHAQYRLVKFLADKYKNITVVGDPDQSIYAWRGADIQNILNFENDYPKCEVIKLERNYRSTANILDAANSLIQFNTSRKPKALWTEKEDGEKISLFEASDEKEEALFVVREILEQVEEGKTLAECVVFYRMHAQSRVIEEALRKCNVPYRIVGGVRFYDRKEIKDLIAYLRILVSSEDQVSFKRIVNVPNRGIGKKSMEGFESFQRANGLNWMQALDQLEHIQTIGKKAKASLFHVRRTLRSLRGIKNSMKVSELLEQVLTETGYLKALELERTIEAKVRVDNIQEFFSAIQDFEENWRPFDAEALPSHERGSTSDNVLEAFLESITLHTNLDNWDQGSNSLTLMTLHTAKGLEFPVVYMVGLEEEVFPNVNSFGGDVQELEEERRLCYVGMTRAKEKLTLCYADSRRLYGYRQYNLPSRFLSEIPTQLVNALGSNMGIVRSEKLSDEETIVLDGEEEQKQQHRKRILFD